MENSLNRTGAVNFNKHGKQGRIGFTSCSEKFVDKKATGQGRYFRSQATNKPT